MNIQFKRNHPDAVVPSRANPSDIGMDLVAISVYKTLDNGVVLYDTGISVKPPDGFYVEIVPRSSISKTGWMLANNVGIVDPDYRGNLLIALKPISFVSKCENSDELTYGICSSDFVLPSKLQTPFCVCQLVLRKAEYGEMEEVSEFDTTVRGDGGFGSTGSRV